MQNEDGKRRTAILEQEHRDIKARSQKQERRILDL